MIAGGLFAMSVAWGMGYGNGRGDNHAEMVAAESGYRFDLERVRIAAARDVARLNNAADHREALIRLLKEGCR